MIYHMVPDPWKNKSADPMNDLRHVYEEFGPYDEIHLSFQQFDQLIGFKGSTFHIGPKYSLARITLKDRVIIIVKGVDHISDGYGLALGG